VTAPLTASPRIAVTIRWAELTVPQRWAVAETANAMAAGSLDLERLREFLDGRNEPATASAWPSVSPALACLRDFLGLRDEKVDR